MVAHAADLVWRHTLLLFACALLAALATISLLLLTRATSRHAAALGPIAPISDALAATAAQGTGRGTERHFE
jgi:hypothetical protein